MLCVFACPHWHVRTALPGKLPGTPGMTATRTYEYANRNTCITESLIFTSSIRLPDGTYSYKKWIRFLCPRMDDGRQIAAKPRNQGVRTEATSRFLPLRAWSTSHATEYNQSWQTGISAISCRPHSQSTTADEARGGGAIAQSPSRWHRSSETLHQTHVHTRHTLLPACILSKPTRKPGRHASPKVPTSPSDGTHHRDETCFVCTLTTVVKVGLFVYFQNICVCVFQAAILCGRVLESKRRSK